MVSDTNATWALLFAVALLVILLFASGFMKTPADKKVDDFEVYLQGYQETGDSEELEKLLEVWVSDTSMYFDGSFYEEDEVTQARVMRWNSLTRNAELMLIREKQWAPLARVADAEGISPAAAKELAAVYEGDDPVLLKEVGSHFRKAGQFSAAYDAYARAAMIDHEYASQVRGLAYHYGCGDLYRIWGEFTARRTMIQGEEMPLSEPRLTNQELLTARTALRRGQPPAIPESCVLSAG